VLEPNQWRVGDRVALRSITGTPPLDVHIVGDIDGDDRLGGVVIVHIAYLEKLLGGEGWTTFIQARVTRPELAASVARALDERFASFSVPTETTTEKAHMATFVAGFSEVLGALQAIGMITLLVTLLVVANAVAMSVRERTVEIGTLRALGFGRGHLIGLVVSESVVVSFFGGIAGTVAAYVLFASGIIQLPGGTGVSISTDVAVLVRAAALSIPLGALAGLQPAWSAVRVPITDALRHVD
jgi:putative ABC transport system permease protein